MSWIRVVLISIDPPSVSDDGLCVWVRDLLCVLQFGSGVPQVPEVERDFTFQLALQRRAEDHGFFTFAHDGKRGEPWPLVRVTDHVYVSGIGHGGYPSTKSSLCQLGTKNFWAGDCGICEKFNSPS